MTARRGGIAMASWGTRQEDPLLTTAEVSAWLGVADKTVCRWRRSGKLAGVALPGGDVHPQWRYRLSAVLATLRDEDGNALHESAATPDGAR